MGRDFNEIMGAAISRLRERKGDVDIVTMVDEGGVLVVVARGDVAGELLAHVIEEIEARQRAAEAA